MQNEITVRNKIEVRVILMGVYGDEWEMDTMPCKMRLRCGTKLKLEYLVKKAEGKSFNA